MKSTVSNTPCKKELPFPRLMISNQTNLIILFTKKEMGIVIGNPNTHNPIGHHSNNFNMEYFKNFNGSVCLENGDNE